MPDIVGVRFKKCGKIYDFEVNGIDAGPGMRVVVETEMGLNIGIVVIPRHSIEQPEQSLKKVLRIATDEDIDADKSNLPLEEEARAFCIGKVKNRNLPMKIVGTEATLDKKRLIFYFTSEGRIDFRDLVRDLASKFRTRIEMRQIGVRDEARLLASYQRCGRELCCKTWMKDLEPVTMKMAKNQKATLDPSKISGRCGRLMCCLRYENGVYEDLKSTLPKKGCEVSTPHGRAKVLDYEILRQKVTVQTNDERILFVDAKDIIKSNDGNRQAVG